MKSWSKKRKILVGLLLLFLAVQAVRPTKNNGTASGPNDVTTVLHVPNSVLSILKKSCYDCHSDHSDYPWYDEITPVNWWVNFHITEGKRELNFTQFGAYPPEKRAKNLEGIAETVKESAIPLSSFTLMHGDAKLTNEQKQLIADWALSARK